jgi:S-adenosylmethionine hydrolase
MARPIITLITDFGLKDHFVAVMKGVILGIAPDCQVVDITHCIPSHDVLEAAIVLRASHSFFPKGTIHLVVVDPGVGTSRRPILIGTQKYFFVGPDNGVLSLSCDLETPVEVVHLTSKQYFLTPTSNTFHGRDIFSPVAAWLSKGISSELFGERVPNFVRLQFPTVKRTGETFIGRVLRIDRFGNLITNVSREDIAPIGKRIDQLVIELGGKTVGQLRNSYADAEADEVFSIWGSSGLLEISVNQASAAKLLQAYKNQEFVLRVLPGNENR